MTTSNSPWKGASNDSAATVETAPRFFYGWLVVFASFLVVAVSYGIQYSFGVFFKALFEEFGWTRATTAGVYTIYLVSHAVFSFLMGGLSDALGPRKTVILGCLLSCLGLFGASLTNAVWHLYISYGLLVGAGISCGYVPLISTVSRWFNKKRGLAAGIVACGVGAGTLIMSPVAEYFIITFNWRIAYKMLALLSFTVIMGSVIFIRRDPREMGLFPDGFDEPVDPDNHGGLHGSHGSGGEEWSLKEAIFTHQLWLTVVMMMLSSMGLFIVMTHIVAFALDIGISKMAAAQALGLIGGISILGRLAFGSGSDRFGVRITLFISLLGQGVMIFWLLITKNVYMLYLFVTFFGIFYGGLGPLWAKLVSGFFGVEAMGTILGFVIMIGLAGGSTGPVIGGYLHDVMGNYHTAFLFGGTVIVLSSFVGLLLKPPKKNVHGP